MELPPFLASCASSSSSSVGPPIGHLGAPATLVMSGHHPGQPPAQAMGPNCWAMYSTEPELSGGSHHHGRSPPTSCGGLIGPACLELPRGKLEPSGEFRGAQTAPITFHILTTHAAQPEQHYFASAEQQQHRRMGPGVAQPMRTAVEVSASPHYQPALSVGHQLLAHQSVVSSAAQSPTSGAPLPAYLLRQQAVHRQSLSPDVSVDEECSVGGGGPADRLASRAGAGGNGGNGGHQQQQSGAHTARTPPETLEWLRANYEQCEGASLPRCTLYRHYLNHCESDGVKKVNAASFGKLIRSVFQQLKTRRLGTRGNSKYHYNGIRIKPGSALTADQDEFQRMADGGATSDTTAAGGPSGRRQSAGRRQQRAGRRSCNSTNSSSADEAARGISEQQQRQQQMSMEERQQSPLSAHNYAAPPPDSSGAVADRPFVSAASFALADHRPPILLDHHPANSRREDIKLPKIPLPDFVELEGTLAQYGLTLEPVLQFASSYEAHNLEMVDCVKQFRLEAMERLWVSFWCAEGGQRRQTADEPGDGRMGQMCCMGAPLVLFRLCSLPQVLVFVQQMDLAYYQLLLDLLFPDPLRLSLPNDLIKRVRLFGQSAVCWMEKALASPQMPGELRRIKMGSVRLLANALARLSSFAHLAGTAREVIQKGDELDKMSMDLGRVDLAVLHWQADWLCSADCSSAGWHRQLVQQFRDRLRRHCSLEDWAGWLEAVADQALAGWAAMPPEAQLRRAKQFMLGWTLHSSLLIRDITLLSSQSFGQFHLTRLLFDEYLMLTMERKLAKLCGQSLIALMAPEWLRPSPTPSALSSHGQPQRFAPPGAGQLPLSQHQQHFFSPLQRQLPAAPLSSSHFVAADQLPPPGPEPPLDMLNGSGEGEPEPMGQQQQQQQGQRRRDNGGQHRGDMEAGNGAATIRYVQEEGRRAEAEDEEEEENEDEEEEEDGEELDDWEHVGSGTEQQQRGEEEEQEENMMEEHRGEGAMANGAHELMDTFRGAVGPRG